MIVQAFDQRGQTANIGFTITVERDPADQKPFFIGTPYIGNILWTHPVNSSVITVTANDNDLKVIY